MSLHTPHIDWFALSTILVLLAASGVSLLGAVLIPSPRRRTFGASVSALGFLGGLVTSIWLYVDSFSPFGYVLSGHALVLGGFYRDRWTALAQIILCAVGLAMTLLSKEQLGKNDDHIAEFFALLLASAAGMAFFVGAANFMTLFLSLEWFSIALYVMCAIDYDAKGSLEAGLKYLIVGSFGSATLLFGSALVYGVTGTISFHGGYGHAGNPLVVTGLALVIAGLGFKMSAAPFHMWTPDVYEGAPTPVAAWMSAATKVAIFALAVRLMQPAFPQNAHLWTVAFAVIAVASLVIGNLAALVQTNVKRILAYSSISHAGFLLIGLSANTHLGDRAVMFYLIPYSAMAFGSFAVVAAREKELGQPVTLENLAGMGWERPFLGVAMFFFMFGFAGLPIGGGFVGKFYVLAAAYDHGWAWLVVVGVLATLVSLYYYLGVVRAMYMRGPALAIAGGSPPRDRLTHVAVGMALVVSVGSLFAVSPLINLARHAASALPF